MTTPTARLLLLLLMSFGRELAADGGIVLYAERLPAWSLILQAQPTPLRQGPVDFSLLVLDRHGKPQFPDAKLRLTPRGRVRRGIAVLLKQSAADNRWFQAARFNLPSAGAWQWELQLGPYSGSNAPRIIRAEFTAEPPGSLWWEYWPWFVSPPAAAALFLAYQFRKPDKSLVPVGKAKEVPSS